jgi:Family of unknown function (DUF6232)
MSHSDSSAPIQPYSEPGVYIGSDRITLGSTTFSSARISSVSISPEQRDVFIPVLALLFGLFFCFGAFAGRIDQSVTTFMFIFGSGFVLWGGIRIFKPRKVYLVVTAGTSRAAMESTNGKHIGFLAAKIQKVISR